MKTVVVYESHWGNTAAVAKAIAQGLGGAPVLSTAEATADALAGAELIVAGAPVLGFRTPAPSILHAIEINKSRYKKPPDLSHPAMQTWLAALPAGSGRFAAFETRIWWSPGGATGGIERGLSRAGYRKLAKARRFLVTGLEGPLRVGELDKAEAWGKELAQAMS